jgi:ABC-2 type transport system ATP-binding protein
MSSPFDVNEAPPGPELVANDLRVAYGRGSGRRFGLDGLSAGFGPGITGLIGPNGAGKSTLLRAACGLLAPAGGVLRMEGEAPSAYVSLHGVGFLPESPPLPGFLTVREFLDGMPPRGGRGACSRDGSRLISGLEPLAARRLDALSLGQRKKVALAAALLGGPRVLLLDEPTNGLDPMAVRELREVLTRLGSAGLTVIVSSHHLDELQRIADALVFVSGGRALGSWTRVEALARFGSFDALYEHSFRGRRA